MAYIEKTESAEETVLETKAEPEPVYIDEVFYFIMLCFFMTSVHTKSVVFIFTSVWKYGYKCFIRIIVPALSFFFLPLQEKMDRTLALLQNKDPADPNLDSQELIQLEGKHFTAAGVNLMMLHSSDDCGRSRNLEQCYDNSNVCPFVWLSNRRMWTDESYDWREAPRNWQVRLLVLQI